MLIIMSCKTPTYSLFLQLLFLALNLPAFTTGDEQFVYSGFAGATNLTLDGMATVTPNGLLELTNGTIQLKGHALYPTPLRFRSSPGGTVQSFSTSFVFGIVCVYRELSGHGMSFFVSSTKNFSTALPAQYLGLTNVHTNGKASNHIFAVELDTVQNSEFHDINDNHVGVDINDLSSVQSYYAGYYDDKNGSFHNLTLISREAMQVWVEYNMESTQISVTMAPLNVAKPMKPLISVICNLSLVLTDVAYVGFSAATGMVNSRHYVLGWSFGMNRPAPTIDITKLPELPRLGPNAQSRVLEFILPVATASFLLAVGTAIFLLVRRHLRYAELWEDWEVEYGPQRFSYKDLFRATEGFRQKHLIGTGGFGSVYKGVLQMSKLEIAVKRVSHDSKQGIKEFIAEVASIGHLQHRNLVQLLGYCRRKGELLLVYEYMPYGSLDKYLYGQEDKPTLAWTQRFGIIKGIASGLFYLHEEWEKVVIHRDIKASNVLLDNEMNGRLGDFGLARLYDHGTDPQTTHVVGTLGYLAPELARTGKATPLTDVFAFGMFIFEVICGERTIRKNAQGQHFILADWVLENWQKGSLIDTVDVKLQGEYNVDEVFMALNLGLLCAHPLSNARPNMRQVIQYLNSDMPIPEMMPTNPSFHMLASMQNEGFDPYAMSYPSSMASIGTVSGISGGR